GNWRVGAPIPVGAQPAGLAISLDGTHAYVALSGTGSLATLDLASDQVTSTMAAGKDPAVVLVGQRGGTPSAHASLPRAGQAPTSAPTPTPLPKGSQLPDRLPSGAVSDTFMPAESPVAIAFAPDGTLFYNELHTGKIRVVRNGTLLPDPFYQF